MRRTIAVAIVLAVVVGGGLWWYASDGSDRTPGPEPTKASPTLPTASSGHRFVGRGRSVVEVPNGWRPGGINCGIVRADSVIFYTAIHDACAGRDSGEFSYVFIKPYRVADDVEIIIASKVEAIAKEIADSYRRLPKGWTTMPDMYGYYGGGGDAETQFQSQLSAFGLTAKPRFIGGADWDDIAIWSVKAGTPIRVGTKVAVVLTDATAP